MHIAGFAQSFAMFILVCLGTATALIVAVVALSRMERATVPVPVEGTPRPSLPRERTSSQFSAERVSSPGSCTFSPRR